MPALNFAARFAGAVERGEKRQTIRSGSRIKAGDTLYLYTGMRTKACRKIGDETCRAVRPITVKMTARGIMTVRLDGRRLAHDEMCLLAREDGFSTLMQFVAWFRDLYGLPFRGQVIYW
jgi:hypothetical protein